MPINLGPLRRATPVLAAIVLACTSSSAHATGTAEPACSVATPDQCLDGVSAGVTGGDTLRSAATLGERVGRVEERGDERQAANRVPLAGRSAGEGVAGWGLWGSAGFTDVEGTPAFGPAVTRFDAKLGNVLAGADLSLGKRLVIGAALGYERAEADTAFNAGDIDTDGLTIAPYALLVLSEYLSIDAAAGYGALDNEQTRIDPVDSTPGAPVFLRGTFDSSRWFVSSNLNGIVTRGRWLLGASIGYLKTEEDQDAYTETGGSSARSVRERRLSLTQGHASVDVGYDLGGWVPYARAGYYRDFSRDDGQAVGGLPGGNVRTDFDDDAWRWSAGLRFYGSRFSGGLELEREEGRDDFDSTSVLFSVRADF